MSDFKSSAGYQGFVKDGGSAGGLSFLYGLSDFWSLIFEDTELVERLLQQETIQLADVYSKFLQLTSTISLEKIQANTHSELRLLILNSASHLGDNVYSLPDEIAGCDYLIDRPMLPLNSYENGVHYHIDLDAHTVQFFAPLEDMQFPSRALASDETEYSLWMTDVVFDEQLVYKYYGTLIDVTSQNTTNIYKDFIKGLYFLYTQGPILRFMERGLSLAIGVPLARASDTVLLTVKDSITGNWTVVTENLSYVLPYGIAPTVVAGDSLVTGEELVKLAEVSDYLSEGEWWIDLSIPSQLIPEIDGIAQVDSNGEPIGFNVATSGSTIDHLMRDYLKYHTFLVRLKWEAGFTPESFEEIFKLISNSKPSYTYPIYVWDVPLETEQLVIKDEEGPGDAAGTYFKADINYGILGQISRARNYIRRDLDIDEERGQGVFIHSNYDPTLITVDEVVASYQLPATRVYPDLSATFNTDSSRLVPLYNTTRFELLTALRAVGVTNLPVDMPGIFAVTGIDATVHYLTIMVREPDTLPTGYTGDWYNVKPLDMPTSEGEPNRAFIPDELDMTADEDLLIIEASSNLYSVMWHRPGGNSEFTPVYFPTIPEDPMTIGIIPIAPSLFTPVNASPAISFSNDNLTIEV